MGNCPHIVSSKWLATGLGQWFFSCIVHVSLGYVTVNLLCWYAALIFIHVMFAFNGYFIILSVFSFTSFPVFCALLCTSDVYYTTCCSNRQLIVAATCIVNLTTLIQFCENTYGCNDMKPITQYEETRPGVSAGIWYELIWLPFMSQW